jgi:hypothetical protein
MTDWRSVAAAVDDTTAVLDSRSLKRGRQASPSVKEEKTEQRTKSRTFALRVVSRGMGGKSVMKERRVWRILGYRYLAKRRRSLFG